MRKLLLTLATLFLLVQSSWAQEKTVTYRLEFLTATKAPSGHILDSKTWKAFTKKAQILESIEGPAMVDRPLLVFPGQKKPITFFDPRPNRTQVQYVDVGLKLDLHLKEANGAFYTRGRAEYSKLSPHPDLKARAKAVIAECDTIMKRNQTGVLLAIKGPLAAKHIKELYPNAGFSGDTYFIMALTLE